MNGGKGAGAATWETAWRDSLQTLLVGVGCGGVVGLLSGRVLVDPGAPRQGPAALGCDTQPLWGWCDAEWCGGRGRWGLGRPFRASGFSFCVLPRALPWAAIGRAVGALSWMWRGGSPVTLQGAMAGAVGSALLSVWGEAEGSLLRRNKATLECVLWGRGGRLMGFRGLYSPPNPVDAAMGRQGRSTRADVDIGAPSEEFVQRGGRGGIYDL